jgi:hypothetical protein
MSTFANVQNYELNHVVANRAFHSSNMYSLYPFSVAGFSLSDSTWSGQDPDGDGDWMSDLTVPTEPIVCHSFWM